MFDGFALNFILKKIATFSGDVRKCLQIVKEALAMVRNECQVKKTSMRSVSLEDARAVFLMRSQSVQQQVLRALTDNEALLMISLFVVQHNSEENWVP